MIKVTCQLDDYSEPAQQEIKIHNHWNSAKLVEVEIGGKRYVVAGADLKAAVDNAMNTNR